MELDLKIFGGPGDGEGYAEQTGIKTASVTAAHVLLVDSTGAPYAATGGGGGGGTVNGSVSVNNFPAVQAASITNYPAVQAASITNTSQVQSASVTNFPAIQAASITNFPPAASTSSVVSVTPVGYGVFQVVPSGTASGTQVSATPNTLARGVLFRVPPGCSVEYYIASTGAAAVAPGNGQFDVVVGPPIGSGLDWTPGYVDLASGMTVAVVSGANTVISSSGLYATYRWI